MKDNIAVSQPWNLNRRHLFQLLAAVGCTPPALANSAKQAVPQRAAVNELMARFRNPPASANLGAYWYWLGGNVTAEGITADLEAMRDTGITQPMLFSIGKGDANSPVKPSADALTDHWWNLVKHAVRESDRLGLTLALNACDGWATASGPWITPELSMQHVVWSEQTVEGGKRFSGKLPVPAHLRDYYRDIAILALPFPEEWDQTSAGLQPRITTNLPLKIADPQTITDPANKAEVVDTKEDGWIVYNFDDPFTLRSVTVHTPSPEGFSPGLYRAANSLEVQASVDGVSFRTIGALEYPKHGWQTDLTTLTHAVPQTTARYYRLVHRKLPDGQSYEEEYDFGQDPRLRFFSIVLSSEPRIHHYNAKNGDQWAIGRETTATDVPDTACVSRSEIKNLTAQLLPDGTLTWTAPRGRWRILRVGCSTTGFQNSAAGGAQGLECDRFNADAVKLQFDSWFAKAIAKVGPQYAGKSLHVIHVDSWEAGAQNWSPGFENEFRRLRGYDLMAWLPVMAGVPVESAAASERILFDLRRTVNDLTSEKFFKTIADLAHANGCVFSAEPANPTYFYDGLEYAAYADMPMGEFWLNTPRNDKPNDIKDAASAARIYGKTAAGAESFTEGLMNWRETPYSMKALGDHIYCEGINRFMLHVYSQQPWLDRAPGMTLNGIGSFVSRTQTWWKPGRAWLRYLRRCQALLQAGSAVSDICAFTGENIPARALLPRNLSQPIPPGHAYDSINRDALLRLARVENGEIALESGMRYRVLLLPDDRKMTPQLAAKLRELVHAGACIVGPPPERSPSLEETETADDTVRAIARELWGDLDGKTRTDRKVGLGRVVWGKSLQSLFDDMGLAPDVEFETAAKQPVPPGTVEWTHRRGAGWDVYFVSNQSSAFLEIEAAFRVDGRVPEIWYADTGRCEEPACWSPQKGRTKVPLKLDPSGSLFIVFAKMAGAIDPIVAVEQGDPGAIALRQGRGVEATLHKPGEWRLRHRTGRTVLLREKDPLTAIPLAGPWRLRFAERLPAPLIENRRTLESWTAFEDPALKYYSGTVTYRTAFRLPRLRGRHRYLLDLGDVRELAEVRVNGRLFGVLWKPPFVIDVTEAARPGANVLEIDVTNTWNNRLIGDTGKPDRERVSYVVPMLRKGQPWLPSGDDKLVPSGLLGPVLLRPLAVRRI
jgi:hypothetical protein